MDDLPLSADGADVPEAGHIAQGLRWSGISMLGLRIINICRGLLLARILGPEPFGVFASVVAFTSLASIVSDGFGAYLVSVGHRIRKEINDVVWLLLWGGVAATVLVIACSGLIAMFYRNPQVQDVAMAMAPTVFFTAVLAGPMALLSSELRFRRLGSIQMVAETISLAVGLGLAWLGAGVWALVASSIVVTLTLAVGCWIAAKGIRPSRGPEFRSIFRRSRRFTAVAAGSTGVWSVAIQGDNIIIGRMLGPGALGMYAFAYNYGVLSSLTLGSIIGQVAFPVFAQAREDRTVIGAHFVRFSMLMAAIICPVNIISAVFARDAVLVLLGSDWLPAVAGLQIMLITGIARAMYPAGEALRSIGKQAVMLRVGLVAAPMVLLAAVVGARGGVTVVVATVAFVLVGASLATTAIAASNLGLSFGQLATPVVRPLVLSIVCAVVPAVALASARPWVALCVGLPLAFGGYGVAMRTLAPSVWSEVLAMVTHRKAQGESHA